MFKRSVRLDQFELMHTETALKKRVAEIAEKIAGMEALPTPLTSSQADTLYSLRHQLNDCSEAYERVHATLWYGG